ncbi:MAG TPA: DUF4345 family protein [Candidatus Limnocylindria bacterium]|nr:DUF4345 family protein [Candidatus Limnocylindria bacterium]
MVVRIFLAAMAIVWLPYGLYCFLDPNALRTLAGVTATTPTAMTELRAMYGGLQSAVGTLALLGTVRHDLERCALVTLATLLPGLAAARLLGLVLDHSWSAYTAMGLAFEITGSLVTIPLLRRR